MNNNDNLRERALRSFLWAIAQSWGGKLIGFVMFLVLARLLAPAEFGLLAAAMLVIYLQGTIAEFGFGEALIQNQNLQDEDINLPFLVSMVLSVLLSVMLVCVAGFIEDQMKVPGLGPVIQAIAVVSPLGTAVVFQESLYRKHLLFRSLALRTLVGTAVSGVVACILAFKGWGVWALVAQQYLVTLTSLVWLWSKPVWKPSLAFQAHSFKDITRFSSAVLGARVFEFTSNRVVDFIILGLFGPVMLGFYTAGTKLHQTLLLLLQSVLSNVATTILSKIAHNPQRIRTLYLNSVTTSTALFSPIFVVSAALAPQISDILFGHKWESVDQIIRPFLLLGAAQCVGYLNGSYFNALGRPVLSLFVLVGRTVATFAAAYLAWHGTMLEFVNLFCLFQVASFIPSYFMISRVMGVSFKDLFIRVLPFVGSSVMAYFATLYVEPYVTGIAAAKLLQVMVLGAFFVCIYGLLVALFGLKRMKEVILFIKRKPATSASQFS